MDKRQITNYVNFTALILYIIGRVMSMGILCWIGLGIMTLSSIWTIIHWKENDKIGFPGTRRTLTLRTLIQHL